LKHTALDRLQVRLNVILLKTKSVNDLHLLDNITRKVNTNPLGTCEKIGPHIRRPNPDMAGHKKPDSGWGRIRYPVQSYYIP